MKFMQFIASIAAIIIAAYVLPVASVTLVGAIIAAVVLGILNMFIKPIIQLLTLPITIVTLGLFSLVINGFLMWGTAYVVPGFNIDGFLGALIFSVIVSLITAFFGAFAERRDRRNYR